MVKALVLIELNEINFDLIKADPRSHRLHNLRRLLEGKYIETRAEDRYELLEPWIQWASVHTGLSYDEHGVFRLGDMADQDHEQFFERLENAGVRVGAISPMNAANRLREPAYFLPDPWTRTPSDTSFSSRVIAPAIAQAVNDNSEGRLTPKTLASLAFAFVRFSRPKNWWRYVKLVIGSMKGSWRKALVLDLLLHDIHLRLLRRRRPQFSTLFLNAGAHIQHHYFFNFLSVKSQLGSGIQSNPAWYLPESEDPLWELLKVYDAIIGEYLSDPSIETLIATGLSQIPYDHVKYYWRLRNHSEFLRSVGIDHVEVLPRMTRDFLIRFADRPQLEKAKSRLEEMVELASGVRLFDEIDDRGDSLFVTLTFGKEIKPESLATWSGGSISLSEETVFVAIKNGMHSTKGFAFFSPGIASHAPPAGAHVRKLHDTVLGHFGLSSPGIA